VPEFKILNNVLEHMESTGTTYKLVELSVDQELTDQINKKYKTSYSLADIEKATDKCLAHEWLKYTAMGGSKYSFLGLTPKGVGAARSKQKAEELKSSRSWLKKSSDYIEDHKGILIFFGAVIALATFILKVTGE
jgi:hypothetical protein